MLPMLKVGTARGPMAGAWFITNDAYILGDNKTA
jgi:hypothetical protein